MRTEKLLLWAIFVVAALGVSSATGGDFNYKRPLQIGLLALTVILLVALVAYRKSKGYSVNMFGLVFPLALGIVGIVVWILLKDSSHTSFPQL